MGSQKDIILPYCLLTHYAGRDYSRGASCLVYSTLTCALLRANFTSIKVYPPYYYSTEYGVCYMWSSTTVPLWLMLLLRLTIRPSLLHSLLTGIVKVNSILGLSFSARRFCLFCAPPFYWWAETFLAGHVVCATRSLSPEVFSLGMVKLKYWLGGFGTSKASKYPEIQMVDIGCHTYFSLMIMHAPR